jgi:biotin carboxyl carrier protein
VRYFVTVNGREHEVDVVERLGELTVCVDGQPLDLRYEEVDRLGQVALFSEGRSWGMSIEGDEHKVLATIAGHQYEVELEDERERAAHAAEREAAGHGGAIESVMPGVVVQILVGPGDAVEEGQPLLILEAMKMQNEIAAPAEAVIEAVHVAEGQAIESGVRLITLAPAAAEARAE